MNKNKFYYLALVLSFCLTCSAHAQSANTPKTDAFHAASARLPFLENTGQLVNTDVQFYAPILAGMVKVMADGTVATALPENTPPSGLDLGKPGRQCVFLERVRSDRPLRPEGRDASAVQVSSFIGAPDRWRSGIPAFSSVSLGRLADGIEVALQVSGRHVEKIFTLAALARPEKIWIEMEGIKTLSVDAASGELRVLTPLGEARFSAPIAWQETDGIKSFVDVAYRTDANGYGFKVGTYDRTKTLVIDPVLNATFIGGSKADYAQGIAIDRHTNVYIAGASTSSDFPVTPGAYDVTANTSHDVVICKFDASLSTLLAATYLGGSAMDVGYAIALDRNTNVFVAGYTLSANFPVLANSWAKLIPGAQAGFVAKLSRNLDALLGSTYIGGYIGYDSVYAIGLSQHSRTQRVYVAGTTSSTDFPVFPGRSYSAAHGGGVLDGFVAKFTESLDLLLDSTYLGGNGNDVCRAIDVQGTALDTHFVYLTGYTESTNFPTHPVQSYDRTHNGGKDAFWTYMRGCTNLLSSTFIGGLLDDEGYAVKGTALAGSTRSLNFPTTGQAFNRTNSGGSDGFFVFLSGAYSAQLSAGTYLGGTGNDYIYAMAAVNPSDGTTDHYLTGETYSTNFPVSSDAYCQTFGGASDVFIARINYTGTNLVSSTYYGGSDADRALGLALDAGTNVFVCGYTASSDLPMDSQSYDSEYNGSGDAFVAGFRASLSHRPDPPAMVSASDGTRSDGVYIRWSAVGEADSYEIWRGLPAGPVSMLGSTTYTNYLDSTAAAGTVYNYVVYSKSGSLLSAGGTADTGWRNAVSPIAVPTGVSASDGTYTDRVRVTWDSGAEATSYEVWRNTNDNSGAAQCIAEGLSAVVYDDTAVVPERIYYYWVKAVQGESVSAFSAPDSGFLWMIGPLITANGMMGDVHVNSGDPLSIAIRMLNVDPYIGTEVDWWIIASAGPYWFYLDGVVGWTQHGAWRPVYQGGLFNLPELEVLNIAGLGPGLYTFYFAVDYPMDGVLNVEGPILADYVNVIIP